MTRPTIPNPTPPPWPNPPQIPPGGPTYCCYLAAGGDECDCCTFAAEAFAAFQPRNLALGRLGPITLVHHLEL